MHDIRMKRSGWLAVLALFALACGKAPDYEPETPATGTTHNTGETVPSVDVTPRRVSPGGAFTVRASGFAANTDVHVGIGPPDSEYNIVRRTRTDDAGALSASVPVPEWAEVGRAYVIVVGEEDYDPKAVSAPVRVVADST